MTFRRLAIAAIAVSALTVSGCSSSGSPSSPGLASVAPAVSAPANGAQLDAATFAAAMKRPGTVILDVRTPAEFAAGHLPGAINIDVEAASFRSTVGALAKDVPYAVYCRSGNRSATALAVMKALGFTTTFHLGGGIQAWSAAGGAVTS